MSEIRKFSKELAEEIASLTMIDIDGISMLLQVRIKSSLLLFIKDYSIETTKNYYDLVKQQGKNKVGSKEYRELGYAISDAKFKMKQANVAQNNVKRDDKYSKLLNYVLEKYGQDVVNNFHAECEIPLPIYSTIRR